jgi:hypothetical protein
LPPAAIAVIHPDASACDRPDFRFSVHRAQRSLSWRHLLGMTDLA